MLTTNQRGAIAECAIVYEAVRLGIGVYRPVADERADLIFDVGHRLLRVQCKAAAYDGDVLAIRLYSARRAADGLRRRLYTPQEIDAFAAHCVETGACYFFDFSDVTSPSEFRLRLTPTRNNQAKGVKWARDFEFGARLSRPGAVAQLGERLAGSQ